jgi:hypothetical protein
LDTHIGTKRTNSIFNIQHLYTFNFLTDGLLLTRICTGQIDLIRFAKGESLTFNQKNRQIKKDLQNVGDTTLRINILQHK